MEFEAYSVGLCSASVCTSLSPEEATLCLNLRHPTGIASRWQLSEDTAFRDGTPHPCQCPDHPENKHYLFHC